MSCAIASPARTHTGHQDPSAAKCLFHLEEEDKEPQKGTAYIEAIEEPIWLLYNINFIKNYIK